MTVEEIKLYCKNKYNATEEFPFGDVPICYKLNGKIFAQLYPYDTVLQSFSKKVQKQIVEAEF